KGIDYAVGGRLRKLRPDEAWAAIERREKTKGKDKRKRKNPRKIEKITKYLETKVLENSAKHYFLENLEKKTFPTPTNLLCAMSKRAKSTRGQASSSREETMEEKPFLNFVNTDNFSGPQWVNLFKINEPVFRELVREFFASFEFDASPCRYEPLHKGATLRLGGVDREMSILELGWRVSLYSERESRDVAILRGLRGAEIVNSTHLTHLFWPSIGDDRFNVGNTKAKSIRNPRIKLAHRCITMTITGRKETTNHVTEIDLFYLYCIFRKGVVCNIPYWLAKYLKSVKDKGVVFGGMFVTRITWYFSLCTNEMISVLSCEPPLHVYRKTSLVKMEVIMELHEGECCRSATREVVEKGEGDDEEG
nr:retrotransposon Orf1 [Tanacetum cinerariifolium]